MNLREQAELDNEFLLEDDVSGFATTAIFTAPDAREFVVKVQFNRIGIRIDPETGLKIVGGQSSVTARISRFPADDLPRAGWSVRVTDITGTEIYGKVQDAMPDRTLGRITLFLGGS